jgi:hypothetical protein
VALAIVQAVDMLTVLLKTAIPFASLAPFSALCGESVANGPTTCKQQPTS